MSIIIKDTGLNFSIRSLSLFFLIDITVATIQLLGFFLSLPVMLNKLCRVPLVIHAVFEGILEGYWRNLTKTWSQEVCLLRHWSSLMSGVRLWSLYRKLSLWRRIERIKSLNLFALPLSNSLILLPMVIIFGKFFSLVRFFRCLNLLPIYLNDTSPSSYSFQAINASSATFFNHWIFLLFSTLGWFLFQ